MSVPSCNAAYIIEGCFSLSLSLPQYLVLYGGSSAMSGNEEVFSDLHYIDITSGQITGTTSIITPSPFPLPSLSLLPFPNNNYISLKVFQIFVVYCACMHPDTRHKMFLCEVILALRTKRTGL